MDQAGDKINDEVNLIIKRGLFELFNEKIPTSEAFEYQIKNDEKSGDLRIIAKYESISSEKKIKVSGVQNIIEKGFDYITGDFVLDIKKSLKNLKYLIIGIIILTALILIFSHTTLKKEFRQIFKKKYKKAQDEIDHKSKLAHNLKKTVNKKHKEKHEIQRIAQQYVEKDVLASTIKKEHPKGGIKKKITSLFVDIRGYTKFAENAKDHELLKTLSLFFKKASDSIYRYNGSINQIAGDQVFAVFNVIKEDKNHILNAAKAALEIRNNFRKLNKELMEKKRKPIKIGIGINTGEALITHLGSSKKMTYTAVGNSVNIASRLQNSASSNQILITKNMLDVIKKEVIAKDLGYINLKNVSKPVNIFDVVKLNI